MTMLKRLLPLGAAALAGATLLAVVGVLRGPAEPDRPEPARSYTAAGKAWSIATPAGWRVAASGPGGTVLRRTDGRGHVVVRERGAIRQSYAQLARGLTRRLKRELPDFRPAGSRTAKLRSGNGLLFTFVRTRANTAHSIVVAPAGRRRAYTLDLVAAGDAPDVARELGGMVRSFAPRPQA
jgi:hypothetical protein